jgi:multisubunit Na+/H+ antiporter MnhB subunit
MPLINLIVVLVVVGLLMWLVNSYIPMQEPFKRILNVVVIIAVVLWLLGIFLGWSPGSFYVGPHR